MLPGYTRRWKTCGCQLSVGNGDGAIYLARCAARHRRRAAGVLDLELDRRVARPKIRRLILRGRRIGRARDVRGYGRHGRLDLARVLLVDHRGAAGHLEGDERSCDVRIIHGRVDGEEWR